MAMIRLISYEGETRDKLELQSNRRSSRTKPYIDISWLFGIRDTVSRVYGTHLCVEFKSAS